MKKYLILIYNVITNAMHIPVPTVVCGFGSETTVKQYILFCSLINIILG